MVHWQYLNRQQSPSVSLLFLHGGCAELYTGDCCRTAVPCLLQEKRLHAIFFFFFPFLPRYLSQQFTPHPSQHVPPLGNFCLFPSETGFAFQQVRLTGSVLRLRRGAARGRGGPARRCAHSPRPTHCRCAPLK